MRASRALGSAVLTTSLLLALGVVDPAPWATASSRPRVGATSPTVSEHAGFASVRLTVPRKARSALRIHFRTIAGTARPGSDYVARSGTATIARHHRASTIRIRIVDDRVHEGPEHFWVALSSKRARFRHARVPVTVVDDDAAPPTTARLHGTITYHLHTETYFAQMELASPGNQDWASTFTLHVSLIQAPDGSWVDDGTGSWGFASANKLWFRRGEGADTQDNGFPFGCADDPVAVHFYRQVFWFDGTGENAGPFLAPTASPGVHQATLRLAGYHPDGTGAPVLSMTAHLRPDRFETRPADGAHICDPDTAEQPNPIVHQGDDPYLDVLETDGYRVWIPRDPDTGGLPAAYDGSGLDFSDGAVQTTHSGFYNDVTGHWSTETTDTYTVSGHLTLG